jgi:hypothetical protein
MTGTYLLLTNPLLEENFASTLKNDELLLVSNKVIGC